MSEHRLTQRERDRLAVMRVIALAADPEAVKVEVWRADLLALLEAVDRLAYPVRIGSLMVVHGPTPGACLAGNMTVHQTKVRVTGEADDDCPRSRRHARPGGVPAGAG